MWFHTTDYRADRHERRGTLVNRGFWMRVPRPLITCRVLGHVPVIDGTPGYSTLGGDRPGARWVCCDRCGVRPEPQGTLNPERFSIGDRWTGAHLGDAPSAGLRRLQEAGGAPGPFPRRTEGVFGGQLVIGRSHLFGVSVKVGNAGSEHTLAAHAGLPFLGALYLHTEHFGTWLQRRLVPEGYESRVIEVTAHDKRLSWRLWVLRDSGQPRGWRNSSIRIDPRDVIWGERRYFYTDESKPQQVTVTTPDGDSHQVTMTLQAQAHGRPKTQRRRHSWTVECSCQDGIPTGPRHEKHGGTTGWAVAVPAAAVDAGRWPQAAAAASIVRIMQWRDERGWKPPAAAA
jgi:hypothetical protein